MNRRWIIIFVIVVLLATAIIVLAGTQPRVVYDNKPETINEEVRSIYAGMPVITSQAITIESPLGNKGFTLPYDYGSATAYTAFVGFISTQGAGKFEIHVANIDGDSVHITRTNTGTSSYNLITIPVGVWGR